MDAIPSINSPSQPSPAAMLRPDQSRVVESGGVITTRADAPAPAPASLGQLGAVIKSRMSDSDSQVALTATRAPERVLKPYGVAMLPEAPIDTAYGTTADAPQEDVEATEDS